MGRRKKEPKSVHRNAIAAAASKLFAAKGIIATSMDDIAQAAGYSKATLYVYFENKEEIISVLVMESMKKLYSYIDSALSGQQSTKEIYRQICKGLLSYQQEFPLYFEMVLDNIEIQSNCEECSTEEKETGRIGEKINEKLAVFLQNGIDSGQLKTDLQIMPTIFAFWGMLSGLIQISAKKGAYLEEILNLSARQFTEYGFDLLYQSIANGKELEA